MENNKILEALKIQPLSEEEKASKHILGRLYGPIATCKEATRNGRHYGRELWEKALNDDIFKEKIANKGLFLELGHPADREEIDMREVCACIPEMPKIIDSDLYAYVDILDTKNGKLLKTLCDYGFTPGISSRGSGDIIDDNEVDPETFFLECWDIVAIPAVKRARLSVCEGLDTNALKLKKVLKESYNALSDKEKTEMKETLDKLDIKLDEAEDTLPGGTPVDTDKIPEATDTEAENILAEDVEDAVETETEETFDEAKLIHKPGDRTNNGYGSDGFKQVEMDPEEFLSTRNTTFAERGVPSEYSVLKVYAIVSEQEYRLMHRVHPNHRGSDFHVNELTGYQVETPDGGIKYIVPSFEKADVEVLTYDTRDEMFDSLKNLYDVYDYDNSQAWTVHPEKKVATPKLPETVEYEQDIAQLKQSEDKDYARHTIALINKIKRMSKEEVEELANKYNFAKTPAEDFNEEAIERAITRRLNKIKAKEESAVANEALDEADEETNEKDNLEETDKEVVADEIEVDDDTEISEDSETVKDFLDQFKEYDKDLKLEFKPISIDGKEVTVNEVLLDDSEDGKLVIELGYNSEMSDNIDDKEETSNEADSEEEVEVKPEETETEANDDGVDEVIESLKEMIRQKDNLENEVKELKSEKAVRDSKDAELNEELHKYKDAFSRMSEIAANAGKLEKEVSTLTEQLKTKEQTISNLKSERNAQLTENLNSHKADVAKLNEQLITKDKDLEAAKTKLVEQANAYKQKLAERTEVAKNYKSRYDDVLAEFVNFRANMLGIRPADITSKLSENYSVADINRVCDEMLTENVNKRNSFSLNSNVRRVKINESAKQVNKITSVEDGYDIDDSLLELAGLK